MMNSVGMSVAVLVSAAIFAGHGSSVLAAGAVQRLPAKVGMRPIAMPVAVFGQDEREPPPPRLAKVQQGIGVLFNLRSRTVCTAFCVAPSIIVTAAHCLYRPTQVGRPRLADFWFARNYNTSRNYARLAGHDSGSTSQNIIAGKTELSTTPPIDATSDWAAVKLATAVCRGHELQIEAVQPDVINQASKAGRVYQLSYHRDYQQWKPAYSQPCRFDRNFGEVTWSQVQKDFSAPDALLLHTCDTGGASSGSPLLMDAAAGPRVVGVNVGTYVLSKVIVQNGAVAKKLSSQLVANTGVAATAFHGAIQTLQSADILEGAAAIRAVQSALERLGLYKAEIDGTYGPILRAAILEFERANGMPATGLPTSTLAQRLRAMSAAR